jgi:hypothetical protein
MTDLERALVALGAELEYPPQPNLVPGVRTRLERRRLFVPGRRALVFAVALTVLAFGIAMAVPQARSAILRFFHIGSVTVERVQTLPPATTRPLASGLGAPLSRAEAERRVGFRMKLPNLAGPSPTRYYAKPGLIATVLEYGGKPVLLAEMQGEQVSLNKKFVSPRTHVEPIRLGNFGLWITGGHHVIMWNFGHGATHELETRFAGNVLLWLSNDRTFRLEGELDRTRMLKLARQITR